MWWRISLLAALALSAVGGAEQRRRPERAPRPVIERPLHKGLPAEPAGLKDRRKALHDRALEVRKRAEESRKRLREGAPPPTP